MKENPWNDENHLDWGVYIGTNILNAPYLSIFILLRPILFCALFYLYILYFLYQRFLECVYLQRSKPSVVYEPSATLDN